MSLSASVAGGPSVLPRGALHHPVQALDAVGGTVVVWPDSPSFNPRCPLPAERLEAPVPVAWHVPQAAHLLGAVAPAGSSSRSPHHVERLTGVPYRPPQARVALRRAGGESRAGRSRRLPRADRRRHLRHALRRARRPARSRGG